MWWCPSKTRWSLVKKENSDSWLVNIQSYCFSKILRKSHGPGEFRTFIKITFLQLSWKRKMSRQRSLGTRRRNLSKTFSTFFFYLLFKLSTCNTYIMQNPGITVVVEMAEIASTAAKIASTPSEIAWISSEIAWISSEIAWISSEIVWTPSEIVWTPSEIASIPEEIASTQAEIAWTPQKLLQPIRNCFARLRNCFHPVRNCLDPLRNCLDPSENAWTP